MFRRKHKGDSGNNMHPSEHVNLQTGSVDSNGVGQNTTRGLNSNKFTRVITKKPVLIGFATVLVIVIVGTIYLQTNWIKQDTCVANSGLIKEYEKTVTKDGINKLGSVAKKVSRISKSKSDPICAYILTVHNFGSNDYENANKYYAQLKDINDGKATVNAKINDEVYRNLMYQTLDNQASGTKKVTDGQG